MILVILTSQSSVFKSEVLTEVKDRDIRQSPTPSIDNRNHLWVIFRHSLSRFKMSWFDEIVYFSLITHDKVFNRSKQEQLKSVAYLRFSPASAKRGSARFLAWLIEDKEAKRVLNFVKQGSSALVIANLTLNFKNAPSLEQLKR
jgi:hypothetical protein